MAEMRYPSKWKRKTREMMEMGTVIANKTHDAAKGVQG